MIDPRVASGLRDLPPSVMIPRERMLASFRQTFASFGYLPIETPHIERMEVLTGKGAGSDEVLRQIFDVTNKGGTPGELALRFDLTVPLARFVAKHVNELGTPFKRYAIGSVFRGERPAKGRFREFMQCDFDTVGVVSHVADAETIQVIHAALTHARIPDFTISLSTRRILNDMLHSVGYGERTFYVLRALDKLPKIGRDNVLKELRSKGQRTLSEKDGDPDSDELGIITDDPTHPPAGHSENEGPELSDDYANLILGFVEQGRGGAEVLDWAEKHYSQFRVKQGIDDLRAILALLAAAEVPDNRIRIDFSLARGLDYYTGVVFETTVNGWEKFGSISSGGRYDKLASAFTSRLLPGVGASIGLDRLIALLDEAGLLGAGSVGSPVLMANFPNVDASIPVRLGSQLREAGIGVEVYPDQIAIGHQMGYGSKRGHKLAVIVGPEEVGREVFNLRDLATRQEQKAIPWADLVSTVKAALGANEGASA